MPYCAAIPDNVSPRLTIILLVEVVGVGFIEGGTGSLFDKNIPSVKRSKSTLPFIPAIEPVLVY